MQKTILITGCSSGIGLSAAEILHKKGYRVFATARRDSDIVNLTTKGLESIKLDINDSQSIQAAVTSILEKTGGTLDALFNNAGFMLPGAVEDLSRDMIRSQFETNVFGQIELTNRVLPTMRKQGHGNIIFNTSILGIVAMPYRGAYNASKFALEGFAQTLRQELYGANIFVSIIAPGPVSSRLRNHAFSYYQNNLQGKETEHEVVYKYMENNFLHEKKSERAFTKGPEVVVDKLLKILESKKPPLRYYIGFPAHMFAVLRRILPESWLDRFIIKAVKEE